VAEQQASFDAARYKDAQREQWNKDGAAWRRWNPTLDRWYGEVTRQMLDLARIRAGQRILDIAAGAGEPAVSAAERVGPGGCVLATDISEGILELALQVARERGLRQVATRTMDGEKLDLPDACFDAVLCRLGLMYLPHPVRALREWRRALKFNAMMAHLSTHERESAWNEVEASMRSFESPDGFEVPGECLVGAATK
jgi:ubiquinone/menaquinone biosynthesis C-methylase UbiE